MNFILNRGQLSFWFIKILIPTELDQVVGGPFFDAQIVVDTPDVQFVGHAGADTDSGVDKVFERRQFRRRVGWQVDDALDLQDVVVVLDDLVGFAQQERRKDRVELGLGVACWLAHLLYLVNTIIMTPGLDLCFVENMQKPKKSMSDFLSIIP